MNIETVNELIQSLEGAGELSIKETKVMALAKDYQQLAAENAGLKNVFGPGDAVLNFLTIALRHTTYDQIDLDDVTLAFKMSLPETPATDRIIAGIKSDEAKFIFQSILDNPAVADLGSLVDWLEQHANDSAAAVQAMREGADK
ncbi:hypothetical protein [Klebsiella grimontii]|uniref:hypothetical protein n=1 Tax=Klebsiella grimontii TaxID=2058152 RepID=UPI0012B8AB3E|nr:hypothetical protein [Klebsiella grimontii]